MNLRYVQPNASISTSSAGSDVMRPFGPVIRSQIGGKKTRKRGGFVPSVMGGFVTSASKYITPMVLFAAYKMVNRPTKYRNKGKRATHKRRH